MNQTFHRIGQFHKESKFDHTGDDAVELLTNKFLHKLGFFHSLDLALSLDGSPLQARSLLGNLRNNLVKMSDFLIGQLAILPHHTVDQEVRIAADGAGKVGIEVRTQPVVALIVLRVSGLLHGA